MPRGAHPRSGGVVWGKHFWGKIKFYVLANIEIYVHRLTASDEEEEMGRGMDILSVEIVHDIQCSLRSLSQN